MKWTETQILDVLDDCSKASKFPMLDNEELYLAATRLTASRSNADWHIAIEVFGFAPHAGIPDTQIYNFGSNLPDQRMREYHDSPEEHARYLIENPYNGSHFVSPMWEMKWLETEDHNTVSPSVKQCFFGCCTVDLPEISQYEEKGIYLEDQSSVKIYELCRYLALTHRNKILPTEEERSYMACPEITRLLVLDEWYHPDAALNQKPSGNETFIQLAGVLSTGDSTIYQPMTEPNTHWANWPDGGQFSRKLGFA